jgi:hypothetical protein
MNLIKFVLYYPCWNFGSKKKIMIRKTYITLALSAICVFSVLAQEEAKIPAGISMAFRAGNSTELSKYLNSTVQVLLLGKEDFYKKNVAETILKDFFTQYRTRDFVIRHQGGTNDAQYAIGSLKTEKGDFRVYFLLKKVDTELLIHQIRIESDEER